MKQYGDEELSVIAEIARMYYVEGMSQIDIANMLFFSKAKIVYPPHNSRCFHNKIFLHCKH